MRWSGAATHLNIHTCLHCPARRLLILGDQVLPRITSNVSVHPTEPAADPLSEWLESLAEIAWRVPDDVFDALFCRPIGDDPHLLSMATGESVAHINFLLGRGEAEVERIEGGADWYRPTPERHA